MWDWDEMQSTVQKYKLMKILVTFRLSWEIGNVFCTSRPICTYFIVLFAKIGRSDHIVYTYIVIHTTA